MKGATISMRKLGIGLLIFLLSSTVACAHVGIPVFVPVQQQQTAKCCASVRVHWIPPRSRGEHSGRALRVRQGVYGSVALKSQPVAGRDAHRDHSGPHGTFGGSSQPQIGGQ